jgi:hypothetical protein
MGGQELVVVPVAIFHRGEFDGVSHRCSRLMPRLRSAPAWSG